MVEICKKWWNQTKKSMDFVIFNELRPIMIDFEQFTIEIKLKQFWVW